MPRRVKDDQLERITGGDHQGLPYKDSVKVVTGPGDRPDLARGVTREDDGGSRED